MKKITYTMYGIVFIIFTFFVMDFYSNYEVYKYEFKNVIQIDNYDKLYNQSQEERIQIFEEIAKEYNVNLYLNNHDLMEDGTEVLLYYYALGNEELYKKKFDTLEGETDTFTPYTKIYSIPMSKGLNEQIRTWISIEGSTSLDIENAIRSLSTEEVNVKDIDLILNSSIGILMALFRSGILKDMFLILIILVPASFYFFYIKTKESCIMKSFGYEDSAIKMKLIESLTKIQLLSIIPAIVVQLVYLLIYRYNKIGHYIMFYIIAMTIVIMFIFIINNCVFISIKNIKIVNGLYGEKPHKTIRIVNILFTIIFMCLIPIILNQIILNYNKLHKETSNIIKWTQMKYYADYNFGYISQFPTEDSLANEIESCSKAQLLFKQAEQNGGILIDGSKYKLNSGSNQSSYILVNDNYIYLEEVKDTNGNIINQIDKDKITILLPISKKESEDAIVSECQQYFTDMKDFFENAKLVAQGKEKSKQGLIPIEVKYIADNQKLFLYNTRLGIENSHYAINPTIVVTNGELLGPALCLSNMTKGNFKAYIGDEKYTISDIKAQILELNAENMIKMYNSYSNGIAVYILKVKKQIIELVMTFLLICILLCCFITSSVLNYLEANKQALSVKKIHGYSFIKLHWIYVTAYILSMILIYTIMVLWIKVNYLTIIFASIQIMYFLIVIKIKQSKFISIGTLKRR